MYLQFRFESGSEIELCLYKSSRSDVIGAQMGSELMGSILSKGFVADKQSAETTTTFWAQASFPNKIRVREGTNR